MNDATRATVEALEASIRRLIADNERLVAERDAYRDALEDVADAESLHRARDFAWMVLRQERTRGAA